MKSVLQDKGVNMVGDLRKNEDPSICLGAYGF